jgi:hypothetical protein
VYLPAGQPIKYFFTLNTKMVSGDLDVLIDLIDDGVIISTIQGTVTVNALSNTGSYTNGTTVPQNLGNVTAFMQATLRASQARSRWWPQLTSRSTKILWLKARFCGQAGYPEARLGSWLRYLA